MKRKIAFLLALLFTLLLALNIIYFKSAGPMREVFVSRVIDGDTFEAGEETFRLANINTPEKSEKGYSQAKDFLFAFQNSTIEVQELSTDKYGRTLVRAYSSYYINLKLVQEGLAKKFLVDESELALFEEAERNAVMAEKGIWKKSPKYGCFEILLDEIEEKVYLENVCPTFSIERYVLSDESRKNYKFPQIVLGEVNVHSGVGKNNQTDLFWGSDQNIWNNDRDTLYLFDSDGFLAAHFSYGY